MDQSEDRITTQINIQITHFSIQKSIQKFFTSSKHSLFAAGGEVHSAYKFDPKPLFLSGFRPPHFRLAGIYHFSLSGMESMDCWQAEIKAETYTKNSMRFSSISAMRAIRVWLFSFFVGICYGLRFRERQACQDLGLGFASPHICMQIHRALSWNGLRIRT